MQRDILELRVDLLCDLGYMTELSFALVSPAVKWAVNTLEEVVKCYKD